MKKIISLITALVIATALCLNVLTVSAVSGSASLTGPSAVRAGDTITLSYKISGSGLYGASGNVSYNSSQLSLVSKKQSIGGGWVVEFNGNEFVAYDNNLSSPVKGQTTLFTLTFKVNSVQEGDKIKVSCNGDVSDGSADVRVSASYSATVAAPLATNNKLSKLNVGNANITPAFSPDKTEYSANVGFEVSKLQVSAEAEDEKAKVSVSSPELKANGTTKVTVTVTAENGSKKVYTISVHREKDPNYVANTNNTLKELSVDGFLLSPAFTPENTSYIVWLPFETESITVNGAAEDSKASVEVVGGNELLAGQDNKVKVICTAENGEEKVYIITAKRAAGHDGSVDELPPEEEESDAPSDDSGKKQPILLFVILSVIGGFALGFVCHLIIVKFRKK